MSHYFREMKKVGHYFREMKKVSHYFGELKKKHCALSWGEGYGVRYVGAGWGGWVGWRGTLIVRRGHS